MPDTNQDIFPTFTEKYWLAAIISAGMDREPGPWAYRFNVARNSTASPRAGVVSSPSHITREPRTIVPTGQPVTGMPSYGVQPAREAIHAFVMVVCRLRSTTVRSAS